MRKFSDINEAISFVKSRINKRTWIIFHSIGDRDCVGSAIAMKNLFVEAQISTPDFITNNSRKMLEHIGIEKEIKTSIMNNPELVIVVDANRFELLGRFGDKIKNMDCELLFIDHHEFPSKPKYTKNTYILNDEQYNSASSIVYDIIKGVEGTLKKNTALVLINGIVADSANFQNADSRTFMQISELLEISKTDYHDTISMHQSASTTTRKNIIEDIFKADIKQVGQYIIISGLAQYHANLDAEAALDLGADAAVFWSVRDNEASISARLRTPLDKKLNMHLGKIMDVAGEMLDGTGGGHPCAAGAYGRKKSAIKETAEYVINNIADFFSS